MKLRTQRSGLPMGARIALPNGLDLADIDWLPTSEERQLSKDREARRTRVNRVTKMSRRFEREELEYLRKKAAALQAVVEADKQWLATVAERERLRAIRMAEIAKIKSFYEGEQRKELLDRLARATKVIEKDRAKEERAALEARGLIRGKRKRD